MQSIVWVTVQREVPKSFFLNDSLYKEQLLLAENDTSKYLVAQLVFIVGVMIHSSTFIRLLVVRTYYEAALPHLPLY